MRKTRIVENKRKLGQTYLDDAHHKFETFNGGRWRLHGVVDGRTELNDNFRTAGDELRKRSLAAKANQNRTGGWIGAVVNSDVVPVRIAVGAGAQSGRPFLALTFRLA